MQIDSTLKRFGAAQAPERSFGFADVSQDGQMVAVLLLAAEADLSARRRLLALRQPTNAVESSAVTLDWLQPDASVYIAENAVLRVDHSSFRRDIRREPPLGSLIVADNDLVLQAVNEQNVLHRRIQVSVLHRAPYTGNIAARPFYSRWSIVFPIGDFRSEMLFQMNADTPPIA